MNPGPRRNVAVCASCNDPIERAGFEVQTTPAGLVTGRTVWDHITVRPVDHHDHEPEPFTVRHLALIEAAWPECDCDE